MKRNNKTRSTCTPEIELGSHLLDISGYSTYKGMGNNVDDCVTSCTFSVGGHDWTLRFYPDGYSLAADEGVNQRYVSVYLVLMSKGAKVRASCDLSLIDHTTGQPTLVTWTEPRVFVYGEHSSFAPQTAFFMGRGELESSSFLRDDHLAIQCDLAVYHPPRVTPCNFYSKIQEPSPEMMSRKLGKLLETGEFADVTFHVGGETFPAHRMVLAMQSPVFRAELYGPMREAAARRVVVQDMEPAVFKAMLRFIYTGSLPPTRSDVWKEVDCSMMQHLLVAADRYSVDNLKQACQSLLCKNLNVHNAVATLILAYQHDCHRLKDACLEFITGSSATFRDVAETREFQDLKESRSPIMADILEDALERSSKIRRKYACS